MAQQYGYAGQPPYPGQFPYPGQQPYMQSGFQNGGNPYQQGAQQPAPPGFNPHVFMPPPPMRPGFDANIENGDYKTEFGFNSASIRAAFVRKVFTIVSIMLTVVTLMTAIPFFHRATMTFVQHSPGLYYTSYFTFFVVYLSLMCCEGVRRSFPCNFIALGILTLSIGYMTMMICAFHNMVSVLLCLIITAVCCGGIIIFSSQTKYDLTSMYGMVFIFSIVVMVFGLVAIIAAIAFHVTWLYTIYAGIAALLFMVYLAIDIQAIMGGRRHEMSPEDYILAAIQVFLDIIYIFWMLLTLFGSSDR